MKVRDRHVGDPPPASTLVVVQALARPQFRVEIEATAAAY
jgi:enamine deaminase RidA (YjgF/YER057c/UK114 family)